MVPGEARKRDGRFGLYLSLSGIPWPTMEAMKNATLLLVPFKEVSHDLPDDCLHHEPIEIRGQQMNWTIPAHRHEGLHQFLLLEEGGIEGAIDGHAFAGAAPLLLLLAPGSVHGFSFSRDAVGQQVTVPSLTLRQLLGDTGQIDKELGASVVMARMDAGDMQHCQSLFDRIGLEFRQQKPGRVQALRAYATLLALCCARQCGQQIQASAPQGLRDTLVQRYLTLVEQYFRAHQPLGFYADRLGVTVDHLSRTCRAVGHASALQILQERLMLEARRLLAYTQLPVADIAIQLGFDDPAYFSKRFQRHVCHTPTEYRGRIVRGVQGMSAP